MSGPDEAEGDKSFLARWSQRKQEAKQPEPKQEEATVASEVPSTQVPEAAAEPEFDLSSLPTLEELTGTTDITAFLRKGVPEHLRNAALRKSWALDPAIRNYVNPALEYAYDWNTPGGVPGNSELGAHVDVARLVSQIMGEPAVEIANSNQSFPNEAADFPAQLSEREPATKTQQDLPLESVSRVGEATAETTEGHLSAKSGCEDVAPAANAQAASAAAPQQPVRRHGTAKPIV